MEDSISLQMECHDPEQVIRVKGGLDGFYGAFGVTDGYCPRLDGFTDHRPYLLTPATMVVFALLRLYPPHGGPGFWMLGLCVALGAHRPNPGSWPSDAAL